MPNQHNDEPTTGDILMAIKGYAEATDAKLDNIEKRLTKVEATMVTKEYLDHKLAEERFEIMKVVSKENEKLGAFVEIAEHHEVITKKEAKAIMAMPPFPQAVR